MSTFFDTLERRLAGIGIAGKPARFYLAALELGSASVQDIARTAKVSRTTGYALLEKLLEQGLVTLTEKAGRTHVVAENLDVLLENLEDRRRALAELVPDLRSLYQANGHAPRFRLYEGREGIQTVLNAVASARDQTILGILSMRELLRAPGRKEIDRFIAKRVAAGKWLRVIRSQSEDVNPIWDSSAKEMREVRHAPIEGAFVLSTFIYDQQVAFISSRTENYGLIIESSEMANVQRTLFETLWTTAAR